MNTSIKKHTAWAFRAIGPCLFVALMFLSPFAATLPGVNKGELTQRGPGEDRRDGRRGNEGHLPRGQDRLDDFGRRVSLLQGRTGARRIFRRGEAGCGTVEWHPSRTSVWRDRRGWASQYIENKGMVALPSSSSRQSGNGVPPASGEGLPSFAQASRQTPSAQSLIPPEKFARELIAAVGRDIPINHPSLTGDIADFLLTNKYSTICLTACSVTSSHRRNGRAPTARARSSPLCLQLRANRSIACRST